MQFSDSSKKIVLVVLLLLRHTLESLYLQYHRCSRQNNTCASLGQEFLANMREPITFRSWSYCLGTDRFWGLTGEILRCHVTEPAGAQGGNNRLHMIPHCLRLSSVAHKAD